ncbi:unknown [Bacteroides sp. CAG:661]|nr:unknown [Bacteroides sp. CAG:661]
MFYNKESNVFLQRKQCFASEEAMFSTVSDTEAHTSSVNAVFT